VLSLFTHILFQHVQCPKHKSHALISNLLACFCCVSQLPAYIHPGGFQPRPAAAAAAAAAARAVPQAQTACPHQQFASVFSLCLAITFIHTPRQLPTQTSSSSSSTCSAPSTNCVPSALCERAFAVSRNYLHTHTQTASNPDQQQQQQHVQRPKHTLRALSSL